MRCCLIGSNAAPPPQSPLPARLPAARPAPAAIDGAGGNDVRDVFRGHPHRATQCRGWLAIGCKAKSDQRWRPGNIEDGRVGKEQLVGPPNLSLSGARRALALAVAGRDGTQLTEHV